MTPELAIPACPLCGARDAHVEAAPSDARSWFGCPVCDLIYLHPTQQPSPGEARARYELHRNDAPDAGYVRFLRELADPVIERLPPGARGLDFGCGPAPVLASLMTAAGFPCEAYDPCFAPDETLLRRRYDFVTCSEVAEHVHDADGLFTRLEGLLVPRGLLGIMTRFHRAATPFATWWYRRDPTHVCFYAEATMRWVAADRGWTVLFPRPNVAVFSATNPPPPDRAREGSAARPGG